MSNSEKLKRIQPIDIKSVFSKKSPRFARFIPGFIFRYLKRIIHEEDVNSFLEKYGDRYNLDFIEAAIKDFNVTIRIEGAEILNQDGRFIFVANHPLGGFDGLVLMKILSEYYEGYKFLVNDILMNLVNIQDLFVPINKHGKQGVEAAKKIEEAYSSDNQILTFPAGLVSRKIKGQIVDLPWQKNFIMKAIKYKRDVIPVHISGRNTAFFYRLANLRKFFGIKANIEMLYLADETFKHRNKELVVKFGKPISWKTFDKSRRPLEWAKWVKEQVYALDGITHIPI